MKSCLASSFIYSDNHSHGCQRDKSAKKSHLSKGLGLKEEEDFVRREEKKFKGGWSKYKEKERILGLTMGAKVRDNAIYGEQLRKLRFKMIKKVEEILGQNSRPCRGVLKSIRESAEFIRKRARDRFKRKEQFLSNKYGNKKEPRLAELDQSRFSEAKIFKEDCRMIPDKKTEPVIVGGPDRIKLSRDEKNLLGLGRKFCKSNNIDEEKMEVELEQTIVKIKWGLMEDTRKQANKSLSDIAIETIQDDGEKQDCEEYAIQEETKTRMIFDEDSMTLDFRKRKATDLKGNARVHLPKSEDLDLETKLDMLRIECMGEIKKYVSEKCGNFGRQESNLSPSESRSLKSLQTRVKEGKLVVLPTDKTSNFAVMTREDYKMAEGVHSRGTLRSIWRNGLLLRGK